MDLLNTINCPHCKSAKIAIDLDALSQGMRFSCHLCNTVISLASEDRERLKSVNQTLRNNSALGQCQSDYATFS